MSQAATLDMQLVRATGLFRDRFGRPPRFAAVAPGRVNLIGEHLDYNDGFVLPMAIERQTLLVGDTRKDRRATVVSADVDEATTFTVNRDLQPGTPAWGNYVRGVVHGYLDRGIDPGGFDAVVDSTVPVGSGLSSSAAIEVATATLVEAMTGRSIDPVEKVLLCQKAEHTFPGVPCGIMDQFISALGEKDHAMLLDCRSQERTMVPLSDPSVVVLITDSKVRHALTGGEYAERRGQCEAAAKALGVRALRDVTMKQLTAARDRLDPLVYKRACHVVGEIARTLQAADEIRAGVWASVGRLMFKSHESLRDHYEVSTEELDLLVELARERCTKTGGVLGARMTGAGFGGCTVTLVRADKAADVAEHMRNNYTQKVGVEPALFTTRPAQGARVVAIAGT